MEPQLSSNEIPSRVISTEHIVATPGTCGGKPRIAGTRIRVQDIYVWYELQGQSVEEIITNFSHLTMAGVYAALAYFWDHRDEILEQIKEQELFVAEMKRQNPSILTQKRRARRDTDDQIPPG